MANRQSTSNRTTKAERKEQARRERIELERKIARSKRNRRLALVVVLAVVVGVGAFAFLQRSPAMATPGELFRAAADAKQAAGCGAVENVGPYQPEDRDRVHISGQMPPLSTYASVPPASGPHNPVTQGPGVYDAPPDVDRVIHSLEHGAVVVWYAPGAGGDELDQLQRFVDESTAGARVIVAPYDYPDQGAAGSLPAGTQMALVAWHNVQMCRQVSLAAAFDFAAKYGAPPFGQRTYLGEAPEAGASF
jgi:hypothetical protein